MIIREFEESDLDGMIEIWNGIVREGIAFPQESELDRNGAFKFFKSQTYAGVAIKNGKVHGLYILHPNNVGRCSHIANASYGVLPSSRCQHIGEKLVSDSMDRAREFGFLILQFNAVVKTNPARRLYERLGFKQLGTVPKGFRLKSGEYEDICPYYIEL